MSYKFAEQAFISLKLWKSKTISVHTTIQKIEDFTHNSAIQQKAWWEMGIPLPICIKHWIK